MKQTILIALMLLLASPKACAWLFTNVLDRTNSKNGETPPEEPPPKPPPIPPGKKINPEPNKIVPNRNPPEDPKCPAGQLGALAIAEWRNTSLIGSFLSYSKRDIHNDINCFVHFDSEHDLTAWISPYGFYGRYEADLHQRGRIDLKQKTFGLESGLDIEVIDHLVIGGALGYFYSNLRFEKDKGSCHSNSIFFGPYAAYLFPRGAVAFTLFGVKNFYSDGTLEYCPNEILELNHSSWDLNARLEGGVDIEVPRAFVENLTLHPYLQIDYLNVFEGKFDKASSRHSSFFRSLLSLSISKVVKCSDVVLVKPFLSAGWVNSSPLSSDKSEVDGTKYSVKSKVKNQLFLSGEIVVLQGKGLLLGIVYEAFIGSHAPVQLGRVRVEWNF